MIGFTCNSMLEACALVRENVSVRDCRWQPYLGEAPRFAMDRRYRLVNSHMTPPGQIAHWRFASVKGRLSPQSSRLSPAATKQRGRLRASHGCAWSCLGSAQAEHE